MSHDRTTTTLTVAPAVVRARWVLMGLFALAGVTVSSWLARLPAVRDALDLSTSQLGGVLLVGALGGLLAVTVAGALVTRWGGRVSLGASAAGFCLGYVLLGVGAATGSLAVLSAGIFLNGVSFAIGNVPLNVESTGVERRLGRSVLPQFHAAFSIGAVLGSLLGAAMAHLGVSLLVQFVGTGVIALVWRLAAIPHVVLETLSPRERSGRAVADAGDRGASGPAGPVDDAVAPTAPVRAGGGLRTAFGAWRERRTLLIGLVIMSAALSEGSANDWLALAVVDGFGETEAVGAVVFAVFVAAMTLVRILGTRLIDRYGRVAVLRVSGVVSLAGLLLFGFAPSLLLAGVGVAAWGLGAALAVPIGIAAASDEPMRAAGRVAVVSAFASLAHLAAPPLLGLAAETIGARHALLLITGAMVVSVLLAGHVDRPPVPAHPALPRTDPSRAEHRARAAAGAGSPGTARRADDDTPRGEPGRREPVRPGSALHAPVWRGDTGASSATATTATSTAAGARRRHDRPRPAWRPAGTRTRRPALASAAPASAPAPSLRTGRRDGRCLTAAPPDAALTRPDASPEVT